MALLGCQSVNVFDPRGGDRKKIIVWVEIDRCMSDALSVVAGVSLGRRTLKYIDYGKVAASFLNTVSGEAMRVVALDSARQLADSRYPNVLEKKERQMRAYACAEDGELFKLESIKISLGLTDRPGPPLSRVFCEICQEGINDGREVVKSDGLKVCRHCEGGGYYCTDAN